MSNQYTFVCPSGLVFVLQCDYNSVFSNPHASDARDKAVEYFKENPTSCYSDTLPESILDSMRETYYVEPKIRSVKFLQEKYKKEATVISWEDLDFIQTQKYSIPGEVFTKEQVVARIKDWIFDN